MRRISGYLSIFVILMTLQIKNVWSSENNDILSADSLNKLGMKYTYSDPGQALEYSNKALKIAVEQDEIKEIAKAKNNIGIIYFNWSIYEYALSFFIESLKEYQKINDADGLSRVMNNIGVCANLMERADLSLILFKYSLEMQTKYKKYYNIADILGNIGSVYTTLNNEEKAMYYLKKSFSICDSLHYYKGMSNCYNNIGVFFESQDRIDSALYYYRKAYQISIKDTEKDFQKYIFIQNEARMLEVMNRYDEALSKLDYGLKQLESFNALSIELSYYSLYASVYSKKNDYQNAYKNLKKYYDGKDKMMSEQVRQKFNEMLVNFQQEEYKKQLRLLKEKVVLRRSLNIALAVIIVVLFTILVLFIVYFRAKSALLKKTEELAVIEKEALETRLLLQEQQAQQEQVSLKQEISHKERELVSASLSLITKNETISDVETFLNKLLETGHLDKKSTIYKQVSELITNAKRLDVQWNDFFLHFENVYPDFFSRLKERFPKLNANDVKFCAYLRINLGNKDLARIYNISEHSVKIKKYRLRKKLNVDDETDLTVILATI